jgi:hypothetical protein
MNLLPRDQRFFDLFTDHARLTTDAAGHLVTLLTAPAEDRDTLVDIIKTLERRADDITHEVITRIDKSFITPIDREDIHVLASRLDDVIDNIDGIARRSQIFRLGTAPEGAVRLAETIRKTCEMLLEGVRLLSSGKSKPVMALCAEVTRYEKVGDTLYHDWLAKLFAENTDAVHLIKWKEIYDSLEKTLDKAEDVANVLESIAIKHG